MLAGTRGPLLTRHRHDLRSVFALTVWSATTLVAVVLISRRLAGAFGAETATTVPCLAATAGLVLSLAANALWHSVHSHATRRNQLTAIVATLLPPLGVAAALWTTPSAFVGGYLTSLLVVAALATIATLDLFSNPAVDSRALSSPVADVRLPSESNPLRTANMPLSREVEGSVETEPDEAEQDETVPEDDVCSLDEESAETDPSILQWMTRRQSPDGSEAVEGAVRIRFEHGERVAVAHVAFVPPLAGRPKAACQVLVDFAGRARIGVAQAYGLRIEARRSESDLDELSVEVGFSAETRAAQSAAA